MRFLHTAFAAGLLAIGSPALVEAQQPQAAPQGGRMAPMAVVDRWLEGISLTPSQRAVVDSVKARHAPQMRALRGEMRAAAQDGSASRDAVMTRMGELNAKVAAEVRAALTPGQQPVFDRNRDAVEGQRRQMIRRRSGGPR